MRKDALQFIFFILSFQSYADFSHAVVALSPRHQGKHIGGYKKSMSDFFFICENMKHTPIWSKEWCSFRK